MSKILLLIPTYNHYLSLENIISHAKAISLNILVIDDGSNQMTKDALNILKNKYNLLNILTHEKNLGKGAAVISGFKWAIENDYSHCIQLDADGQHNHLQLADIIKLISNDPNSFIMGQPTYEDIPKLRYYSRYITHFWVFMETLSFKLGDTMCGFRSYPINAIKSLLQNNQLTTHMDFDIEIAVKLFWHNTPIKHFKTPVKYAGKEKSNFKGLKDNWRISLLHTKLFLTFLFKILPTKLFAPKRTNHWMHTNERGANWGLKFMLLSIRIFGRRLSIFVLTPIIIYFFLTGKTARKNSMVYLKNVEEYFGMDSPFKNKVNYFDSFKHFLSFGIAAIDKTLVWQGKIQLKNLNWQRKVSLPPPTPDGKGYVILGSHFGNMEIMRSLATTQRKFKINAIVYTEHAKKFNQVLNSISDQVDVNLIHVNEITINTSALLKDKIDQGENLAILADRIPINDQSRTVSISFLGKQAKFPQGPIILASLMGCPVYTLFSLNNQNSYDVYLEKLTEKIELPRKSRNEVIKKYMQTYVDRLTNVIYQSPYQWYTFHQFWEQE